MAQISPITAFTDGIITETNFISRTLSHSITGAITNVNKELSAFPAALDDHLMTRMRQVAQEIVDEVTRRVDVRSRREEENVHRRFFNAHAQPNRYLHLHPHAETGLPVVLPHQGYWADSVTSQKVYDAHGEQINELIHLLGLTRLVAEYGLTGDEERRTYIQLHLGIRIIQPAI
ncbi:hypothetical protein M378DRAFT_161092 [Amanita muscaria Koide BX008]|uniref:Uncharacterized protein n=1 Tax=Amanita muscaria (strain Koide BX008) TaxID=946122 RepID=A0A0C2XBL3_AMAMK|nr:hypothetical protein M378DRAFT_161092 [Amanita muscaria Koide BX008]